MTRRFDLGIAPHTRPKLDGREITEGPVRFYHRKALGGGLCGLWIGGRPVFNVTVYDAQSRPVGYIGPDDSNARRMYDELRRILVADDLRA